VSDPILTLAPDQSAPSDLRAAFVALLGRCDERLSLWEAFTVLPYSGPCGFDPTTLVESSSSEYASQMCVGGHSPGRTFLRNSNRSVVFSLDFRADRADGSGDECIRQVQAPVALLGSLCYPYRSPSNPLQVYAPPLMQLEVAQVGIYRGFMTSVQAMWGGGWTPQASAAGYVPDNATVACTFTCVGFGGGSYGRGAFVSVGGR